MPSRLTATTAARSFSDLLSRVQHRGERFGIVRGGEDVAELVPAAGGPGTTLAQLLAQLADLPGADPGFADDLEAVQAGQPRAPGDPWAS